MQPVKQLAPNQFYFFNDGKIVFQSYDTIVCTIENYENGNNPIVKITETKTKRQQTFKNL